MLECLGNTFVIVSYLLFEMFCRVWVIICGTHKNVMEFGILTLKTHTFFEA
jgi:hypothetical protein